ncbi:flagellar hook assembly protein FlgD [Roseovarius sp. SCSIO 43702]|uniref:flagellar hook capping FlgD N-terminal domain-containing protein n=1 Tax=Roseovarius sp. SCSIO 43702 TaxID=2823043 RepID=UPI001C733FDC|nr:flagellar hook capping FlgD N-terminal domain-containing protein [Roseovarius sp. SCSIO 43702]QYX57107.1 flagellar hook assembly protein FlgD [Roseovarius sp. SCSIO 43702]
MEITQGSPSTRGFGQPDAGTAGSPAISSDFETFLKMLTVQMQNQDPLNPVESADFAVQLAQFSTVEQQVRTNDILSSLGDRLGALGMGQLLGWVGMTARAELPVKFDGAPVPLTLRTEPGATEVRLVVEDEYGRTVQSVAAPLRGGAFDWAGVGDNGQPLPPGTYAVRAESYSGEALLGSHPAEQSLRIVEARNDADGTRLVLETGQEIGAEEVIALRQSK